MLMAQSHSPAAALDLLAMMSLHQTGQSCLLHSARPQGSRAIRIGITEGANDSCHLLASSHATKAAELEHGVERQSRALGVTACPSRSTKLSCGYLHQNHLHGNQLLLPADLLKCGSSR